MTIPDYYVQVEGTDAMVLHGFCDSATPPLTHPYVHNAIVSTLTADAPPGLEGNPEGAGGQILSKAWKRSITEDKVRVEVHYLLIVNRSMTSCRKESFRHNISKTRKLKGLSLSLWQAF